MSPVVSFSFFEKLNHLVAVPNGFLYVLQWIVFEPHPMQVLECVTLAISDGVELA
jgi:hypothetical protein